VPRRVLFVTALALACALAPAAAAGAQPTADSVAPPIAAPLSETVAPPGFSTSARQAVAIADRTSTGRATRRGRGGVRAQAWIFGGTQWEVDYYGGGRVLAEVDVSARGRVVATFTGPQAESYLARGHLGGLLDSPWVWAALAVLFVAPFVDPRRPRRLLHLDLLVLLAFGVSQLFFTRGDVNTSVPLVYPVLGYLLVRMLVVGLRPRRPAGPLVPYAPTAVLAVGLVLLVGGRIALNVANDRVVDVGYASVVGADRIRHHQPLYVNNDVHGDTYGPINYLAYVPFEAVFPWHGQWDSLPAAHAAAIFFDLLTLLGLFLLGRRMRAGPAGRRLGLALAWGWAAYPYTAYALGLNTNDALVSALLVLGLVALARPAARGALLGLAAAAKFAPLALAPLLAAGRGERRPRAVAAFAGALGLVVGLSIWLYLPAGGLREFYDTTIGFQLGRHSPFSLWGLHPGLDWLQSALKAGAALLALALYLVPRRRSAAQLSALAAAVVIAVQLPAPHWFYFYVVWFAPLVLAALFAGHETEDPPPAEPVPAEAELPRVPVPA
jgi:hypothetical protein